MSIVLDEKLRDAVMNIWLKNPKMGQNVIAKEMGITPVTFRRFVNGEGESLKITTKMRIMAWINKMEAA